MDIKKIIKLKRNLLVGGVLVAATVVLTGCSDADIKIRTYDKENDETSQKISNVVEYAVNEILGDNSSKNESLNTNNTNVNNESKNESFNMNSTDVNNGSRNESFDTNSSNVNNTRKNESSNEIENSSSGDSENLMELSQEYVFDELKSKEFIGEKLTIDSNVENPGFADNTYSVKFGDDGNCEITVQIKYKVRDTVTITVKDIDILDRGIAAGSTYVTFSYKGNSNEGIVYTGAGIIRYSNVVDNKETIGLDMQYKEDVFYGVNCSTNGFILLGLDNSIYNE